MTNKEEKIKEIIIGINESIAEHLDEKTLISDGYLDSLDIMKLIIALEDEFDIEIDPEDVLSDNFESIEAIKTLIEKNK